MLLIKSTVNGLRDYQMTITLVTNSDCIFSVTPTNDTHLLSCPAKCGAHLKQRNMNLFEKICKADHILAWTGEDRYLEIRLLHVKGGMGNLMEWQLLADSVEHIHEKRLASKKQVRPRQATTSTSCVLITEEEPVSPLTTRRGTKRDSKIKIDYKQYHREGIAANKVSKTEKVLPHASGPSVTRRREC